MDRETALLRSNRRLRAAVWVLSIVLLAGFGWQYVTKTLFFYSPEANPDALIKASSAIVYSDNKLANGELHSEIREILLLRPGVTFNHKVGEAYPLPLQMHDTNVHHGDGQLVFFTGSPANFKESVTVYDGRVLGFDDMPLDTLKAKILASTSNP